MVLTMASIFVLLIASSRMREADQILGSKKHRIKWPTNYIIFCAKMVSLYPANGREKF